MTTKTVRPSHGFGEQLLQTVEPEMLVSLEPCAAAQQAGDHAVVDQPVGQHEVAPARQQAEDGRIGRVAAAPEQSAGKSVPGANARTSRACGSRQPVISGEAEAEVPSAAAAGATAAASGGIAREIEIVVVGEIEGPAFRRRHPQRAPQILAVALGQRLDGSGQGTDSSGETGSADVDGGAGASTPRLAPERR